MLKQIRNNPAFLSETELIQYFVVRLVDLEIILNTIKDNDGDTNQHLLIIGPRGMGKTMLVLRAATAIRNNNELSSKWFPIVFSEENYEVVSTGQFWLKAYRCLISEIPGENYRSIYNSLLEEKVDKNLAERALGRILDFADERRNRILLIIENMNMLISEQLTTEDNWALRHTLQNEKRIMILGTATARFKEIDSIGKPLFEMFKVYSLEPLSNKDCALFWQSITGKPITEKKVRPIQILTGGNPRLLAIISSFAAGDSFRDLMDNLAHLIDDYTTYFKSNIESLPPIERKVFVILAGIWEPATSNEVANEARIGVSKASAYLKRLVDRGIVVVVKGNTGKMRYQVAERLYNIYYLMRRSNNPSDRVHALVDFMVNFYESRDLAARMHDITTEACHLDKMSRQDHIRMYSDILDSVNSRRDKDLIIKHTPTEFFSLPEVDTNISEKPSNDVHSKTKRIQQEVFDESTIRLMLSRDPNNLGLILKLGQLMYQKVEGYDAAEEIYHHALEIDPKCDSAWAHLGQLLHEKLERYGEAEEAYRHSIEINPKYGWAWSHLGQLLHEKLERYNEAEEAYRHSIEINPKYVWDWAHLGQLLHEKLERYGEAEEAYRHSIEINPKYGWAWAHLGQLLHKKLARYSEAEEAYRRALEIIPSYHWALEQYGILLSDKLGKYKEAEETYHKAIQNGDDCPLSWAKLGELLHEKLERYNEAEEAYRRAIEIDTNYDWAWTKLGELLHEKLGRYSEAEEAYRRASEINPKNAWAWAKLGQLLHEKLERYSEAEEAYQHAIEIDPSYHWALEQYGILLSDRLGKNKEAEDIYRKAIEASTECPVPWAKLGELLCEKMGRTVEAEEAYRQALEIDPNNRGALAGMIILLIQKRSGKKLIFDMTNKLINSAKPSDAFLNHIAWKIFTDNNIEWLSLAEKLIHAAIVIDPNENAYKHTLAAVIGAEGRWEEALQIAPSFLASSELAIKYSKDFSQFFIDLATAGYSKEGLALLQNSVCAPYAEPLIVALQIYTEQKFNAPQEVIEISNDIIREIEKGKHNLTKNDI